MIMRLSATLALLLAILGGCSSSPTTSVLTDDDLTVTTSEMAASLAQSDFLKGRTGRSERAIVVIDKVENLTSDIIPPAEQWMLMARVQGSMPIRQLRETKNIVFVLPPERSEFARRVGYEAEISKGSIPTHSLTATFRSNTRTRRDSEGFVAARVDTYMLEYQLTDRSTREVVWTGNYDFKREAVGDIKN